MKKRLLFLLLGVFIFSKNALSQTLPTHRCASDLLLKTRLADSIFFKKHEKTERQIRENLTAPRGEIIVKIPVVVQAFHNNGPENIPDAQISEGIQHLNAAFANVGFYNQGSGVNVGIQFCLASRAPNGDPTSGIFRHQTYNTEIVAEDEDAYLKNLKIWESTDYIHIYLVQEVVSTTYGTAVTAYATMPSEHGEKHDGIVMEARWMGSSPKNSSILVHEMGHFLGLYHTFEGGCKNDDCLLDGDRVCDTPPDNSTDAAPCNQAPNSCSTDALSGLPNDHNDLISNFLDYGDLACQHDFTQGQSDRMNASLSVRGSLVNSRGCSAPCLNQVYAGFGTPFSNSIHYVGDNYNCSNLSLNAWNYLWYVNDKFVSTVVNYTVSFTTPGAYTVKLIANSINPGLCDADEKSYTFKVICRAQAEFTASDASPAVGDTVFFTNQSTGNGSYEWFVNGIWVGSQLKSFIFDTAGFYAIRLVAHSGNLCFTEKTIFFNVADGCSDMSWHKTASDPDALLRAFATVVLSDGYLLSVGERGLPSVGGAGRDLWISKSLPDGTPLWTKRFGGDRDEVFASLTAVSGGQFALLCTSRSGGADGLDLVVAKFSGDGAILWQKRLPAPGDDFAGKILSVKDGGYIIAGLLQGAAQKTLIFSWLTESGVVLWSKGRTSEHSIFITDIVESNTSFKALGYVTDAFSGKKSGFEYDFYQSGPNSFNNNSEQNDYFTDGDDRFFAAEYTHDRGWILAGSTSATTIGEPTQHPEAWLLRLDAFNGLAWSRVYRVPGALEVHLREVSQAPDGNFYAAGTAVFPNNLTNALFLKISPDGVLIWSRLYGGNATASLTHVEALQRGGAIFTGFERPTGAPRVQAVFFKMDENGQAGDCSAALEPAIQTLVLRPYAKSNPFGEASVPNFVPANLTVSDYAPEFGETCAKACFSETCEITGDRLLFLPGEKTGATNLSKAKDGGLWLAGFRGDEATVTSISPSDSVRWTRAFDFTEFPDRITFLKEDTWHRHLAGCGYGLLPDGRKNGFFFRYDPLLDSILWVRRASPDSNFVVHQIMDSDLSPGSNGDNYTSYVIAVEATETEPGHGTDAQIWQVDGRNGQKPIFQDMINMHKGAVDRFTGLVRRQNNIAAIGSLKQTDGKPQQSGMEAYGLLSSYLFYNYYPKSSTTYNLKINDLAETTGFIGRLLDGDFNGEKEYSHQFAIYAPVSSQNLITHFSHPDTQVRIQAKNLLASPDGFLYVFGNEISPGGASTVFIVKMEAVSKNIVWSKKYRAAEKNLLAEDGKTFVVLKNGYLTFAATARNAAGQSEIFLGKISAETGLPTGACPVFAENFELENKQSSDMVALDFGFQQTEFNRTFDQLQATKTPLQLLSRSNCTPALDFGPDTTLCPTDSLTLDAGPGYASYRWHDGTIGRFFTLSQPGAYAVKVRDFCGNAQTDTLRVSLQPAAPLDLEAPEPLCPGQKTRLERPSATASWRWSPSFGLSCDSCQIIELDATTSTTYAVQGFDVYGCFSSDSLRVEVRTDTVFAALDTAVCKNAHLPFLGLNLPADTTATFFLKTVLGCDSALTVSVAAKSLALTFADTVVQSGSLVAGQPVWKDTTLIFSNLTWLGCDSTHVLVVHVVVGTAEPKAGRWRIFPVPAAAGVWLECSDAGDSEGATFEWRIFSAEGKRLRSGQFFGKKTWLSRGSLPDGVYRIEVSGDEHRRWVGRLIFGF